MIFKDDIYPNNNIDTSSLAIQSVFEVTEEIEFNPVKIAIRAMGGISDADLLWSANRIRNPYKELKAGTILKIPFVSVANDELSTPKNTDKSINLKHIIKSDTNLYY